jgi:hypothetical protein
VGKGADMNEAEKKRNIARRAERILDIAKNMAQGLGCSVENRIEEIRLHYDGYAEPGYSSESGLVATGNWNNVDVDNHLTHTHKVVSNLPNRIFSMFEKMGIECEWSDEWTACSSCGMLVRTSPDSYEWTRSYYFYESSGDIACIECLLEDTDSYLAELEDNPDTANTMSCIDPADHGYIKVNEDSYETGWHPWQNDSRAKVAKELRAKGISRFLFNIDSVGQFDSQWSVYVHSEEEHLLNPIGPEYDEPIEDERTKAAGSEVIAAEVKKIEVPCKFCKTSLWEDETPCWRCGGENPTK